MPSTLPGVAALLALSQAPPVTAPPPASPTEPAELSPETGAEPPPAPAELSPGTGAEPPAPDLSPGTGAEPPPAPDLSPGTAAPNLSPGTAPSVPSGPAAPALGPGERAALRRAARRELLLDPQEVLQNQWPTAPYCNLDARKDVCMTLDSELFAGYRRSALAGGRKLSEFALDRAELGTQLWWRPHWRVDTGVALRIEAVRSAGPQSLVGIDGNSLVMRLGQAYGHGAVHLGPIDLGVRFGQVPERWIEQLEKGYDTRGADPLASERNAMFDRADLGASLTLSGWKGRVDLDLALTNGEGRAQQELNRGKNTTLIVTVRPWRRRHAKGPIALAAHGMYRDGSLGLEVDGAGAGRNHRAGAALTFQSPWAFGGVEYVRAFGHGARPELVSDTLGAWASAHVFAPYVGLLAKYDHTRQDLATAGSQVHVVTAAVFGDAFGYLLRNRRRLRLHVGYQYEGYGAAAGPVPGAPAAADTHRFIVQLTAQGLFRVL